MEDTSRAGHGRRRRLQPIQRLEGRIGNAYTTLNHQLSKSVIDFALQYGAGVIQLEKLDGLKDVIAGTFLGQRWRYRQLQEFIKYKAKEAGITVREIDPRFTSRRCSRCGHIEAAFDRAYRDANRSGPFTVKFRCSACDYEADPDYNAARNLATIDIAQRIKQQCLAQEIAL